MPPTTDQARRLTKTRGTGLSWVAAACGLLLASCASTSREPANIFSLKREIRAYVDSGRYDREIAAAAERARGWVEERAPRGGGRLAIVFDLDETLLANWPHISADDFGYIPARWDAWVREASAPAIAPVRELYRTARRLGVEVIFLTGRHERDRADTVKNLRAIDCGEYAALICKPDDAKETTGVFKTAARRRIVAEGRAIIANIGDQESDLAGGFAERVFKLPNPFYLTK